MFKRCLNETHATPNPQNKGGRGYKETHSIHTRSLENRKREKHVCKYVTLKLCREDVLERHRCSEDDKEESERTAPCAAGQP